jgi:hypothetical protein
VAEELLHRLQVPGRVEKTFAGGMPRLVHPLAAGRAVHDDPGPLKTAVPPVVQAVVAHRLIREAADPVLDRLAVLVTGTPRLLLLHQAMRRLRLDGEDQPFEVEPELRVGDRQLAYLLALREHRQSFAVVVEVLDWIAFNAPLRSP